MAKVAATKGRRGAVFRGARASRALVEASRLNELLVFAGT